ncbi:ribbon-helix-helix domain-containing protein [Haloquadratum walsbyi]|jgi:hypothetical protein|uniref:Uncharacterized protein n=1 Tax=Haloquadratum walsbyi J07HQW2 TaxID=1238425 RepID=U1PPT8_9EURY|nr:ribbon-helix-helix domain-containing protein [Haloquadratum walsbyi]ERG94326.1 MAG: hypothetical protein J07HQW2_00760 [Haloquadratum walsbyi J07HQW2]
MNRDSTQPSNVDDAETVVISLGIPTDLERRIESHIESGLYQSQSELIQEAIRKRLDRE